MESSTTSNSFARMLVFYESVKRTKLNEKDMMKILKKYEANPASMMNDLKKKYSDLYHFPDKVLLVDLQRIQNNYTLPERLIAQLPKLDSLPSYNSKYDIRSLGFDPNAVLTEHRGCLLPCAAIPGAPKLPIMDNMTKVKHLLPCASSTERNATVIKRKPIANTRRNKDIDVKPLERIALSSTKQKISTTNEKGEPSVYLEDGPLLLLYNAMKRRQRIRVVIRHSNSVRGTLDGVVHGFDRHFNLLLTNVEERYVPSASEADKRIFVSQAPCPDSSLIRQLPQILVRGDNVVLVCLQEEIQSNRVST